MKKLVLLLVLVFVGGTIFSQTSKSILNKLSEKTKGYSSIYAEYESTMVSKINDLKENQSGKIKIQGDKYNLELGKYNIITNGEDIWSYSSSDNECTLDNVEDMEDDVLDPSKLFTIWEKDFKHSLKGEVEVNGVKAYEIYLFPLNANDTPYHTVKLYIDKAKMEIVKIEMNGRDGTDYIYTVKNFQPNYPMQPSDFIFDASAHPGVEIIDNRI